MQRRMFVSGIIVLCFAVNTAFAADVFSGTWKVRETGAVVKVEAVKGGLKYTNDGHDAAGKPTHVEYTAMFDGTDYPVKGDPTRDMVALKKISDYAYEAVDRKAGKAANRNRIVISSDGKTRTSTPTLPDGKVNAPTISDRQ